MTALKCGGSKDTWPASGLTLKGEESAIRRLRLTAGMAAAEPARPSALLSTPATLSLCCGCGSSTRPAKPSSSASRKTATSGAYATSLLTRLLLRALSGECSLSTAWDCRRLLLTLQGGHCKHVKLCISSSSGRQYLSRQMPQLEGGQLPFSDNKLHAVRLMLTYLGAEGLAYALPGDSPPPSSLREELDSMSVGLSAGIVSRPGCCCSCTYTQGLKT